MRRLSISHDFGTGTIEIKGYNNSELKCSFAAGNSRFHTKYERRLTMKSIKEALAREYHRGELYYANLGSRYGSEQDGYRPVLIVQNDYGNYYSPTLLVAPITSNVMKKRNQPTHVELDISTGLRMPSMALLEQVHTVDKRCLEAYIGRLTTHEMRKIDDAIRVSMGLTEWDDIPTDIEAP